MSYTPSSRIVTLYCLDLFPSTHHFGACFTAMTTPNSDNPLLPLDELNIVPEWLKSAPKSYENHAGEDADRPRRDRDDRRPPRPRGDRPPRPQGDRPPRREGGPPRRDRPPRREGPRPMERRPSPPIERRPPPPANVEISFLPEEKGLAAMIETMKHSPRAYSLFDVAKLILNKPERHLLKIALKPGADGARAPLFLALADETVFTNRDEALRHVFRRYADKLCRTEKKPCDPPKGSFTSVNRCGITGETFGPSNYHDYHATIVRFHQRRLRHMSFDEFRSRIQAVKDEAAVKAWVESKSFVTEHHCLLCAEPKPLASRDEVEKHLTDAHLDALVTSAPELQISGAASRRQTWAALSEALRIAFVSEWRFPLKTAQILSDKLRPEGFHFFKHRKGVTYVSHIKPKRVESLDGLSDQIQKIITFLRAHPDSVRKQLADNLQIADQDRFMADLHWLIMEGSVVEFADGRLWALENKPSTEAKPEPASSPSQPDATPASQSAPASSPEDVPSTPVDPPPTTT